MYKYAVILIGLIWFSQGFSESLPNIDTGKVVLPWEELKKLLEEIDSLKQKKNQADKQPSKESPPVEYSITEANFLGEVKGGSVKFEGKFSVQVLKEGWVTIPFFSNEVGIETIRIELSKTNKPEEQNNDPPKELHLAHFVRDAQGYSFLAKGPKMFSIQVSFYVPIQMDELTYTISFLPPRSVTNHLTLKIPEKGVNLLKVNANSQFIQEPQLTTVETVLSERDTLNLSWKIEKESGIHRKSLATLHALASVDKSEILVLSTLTLEHLTTLEQISLRLPLEAEILNLKSLNVEQWATEKQGGTQVIKVTGQADLHTPLKMDISYRLRLSHLPIEIMIPSLMVTGVDNFEGALGIEALGNLEISPQNVQHGISIPAKNLPKPLWQKASNPLLYGYQFYENTFSLTLGIKSYQEIQTIVANVDMMDGVTHRTLEGKSMTRVLYAIRNNDRQFLTLTLPDRSHLWQAFLDGTPVKPAQKDTKEILIPMKKSFSEGEELQSFSIEIGYVTEVDKLSLKGDILNQLPMIDIPMSYLRWSLFLPEYYEYSRFEGPLKQVLQFSNTTETLTKPQIDIPTQGQHFLFEKHLVVDEKPYVRGKYGQFLGNDIFLSLHPMDTSSSEASSSGGEDNYKLQVIPNRAIK